MRARLGDVRERQPPLERLFLKNSTCHFCTFFSWQDSVWQNTCVPLFWLTKNRFSLSAGSTAALIAAAPGLAMGPGGSAGMTYVLYGCGVSRSFFVMFPL